MLFEVCAHLCACSVKHFWINGAIIIILYLQKPDQWNMKQVWMNKYWNLVRYQKINIPTFQTLKMSQFQIIGVFPGLVNVSSRVLRGGVDWNFSLKLVPLSQEALHNFYAPQDLPSDCYLTRIWQLADRSPRGTLPHDQRGNQSWQQQVDSRTVR